MLRLIEVRETDSRIFKARQYKQQLSGGAILEKTRLSIAQVTPGMKLAEPITNAGGITLMPAGIRLTPMFIARIKKWNMDAVEVFVDKIHADAPDETAPGKTAVLAKSSVRAQKDDGAVSESLEQFARAVATDVAKVFVNVRDNPLMMQLRAIAIRRLVGAGPEAAVNSLRRGPLDDVPLPAAENS